MGQHKIIFSRATCLLGYPSQLTIACYADGECAAGKYSLTSFFFTASATYMLLAGGAYHFVFFSLSLYVFYIFYFLPLFFFLFPSSFHPFIFSFLFPHLLYLFIYYFVFILFPDYEPHIHNLIYNLFFYNLY